MNDSKESTELISDLYSEYAKYVIKTRALPSIYDGLKAVQRRLIYVALQYPNKMVKSANIVGDVMKYHPHGSSYGALVNMTSNDSYFPLFDGKGNFGGKNFGAASSRYTEAKLSEVARKIYSPLIKYADYTEGEVGNEEPRYIPALLPYGLLNGSYGIGIGISTTIPSVNPIELIDYYIDYLEGNDTNIPRPEYGGMYLDQSKKDVDKVIRTGKGRLRLQSVVHQENDGKFSINNLPPGAYINRVLNKIQRDIDKGYIDYRDESTAEERYVFEINSSRIDPDDLLNTLERKTRLRKSYDMIFSDDETAVYCGLPEVVARSVQYLIKCTVRKYTTKVDSSQEELKINTVIEQLRESGDLTELVKSSKSEAINYIVDNFDTEEEIARKVIAKPISYLTKSHESILDEIREEIKEYEYYRDNPENYLVELYEDLRDTIKSWGRVESGTYYKEELIKNPKVKLTDDKLIVSEDEGIEFDKKVILVGKSGKLYPRNLSTKIRKEYDLDLIAEDVEFIVPDTDRYIGLIVDNEKMSIVDQDIVSYDRNFLRIDEDSEVTDAFSQSGKNIILKDTDGNRHKLDPAKYQRTRYSYPYSLDFKVNKRLYK